jgi:hypothetical protein
MLEGREGHVLALQATGVADGRPTAWLAIADAVTDLAELAAGLDEIEVLFLTTQASVLDAPDDLRFSGARPVYVLVDQPVPEQLRHTFAQGASIRWARVDLGGDRELILFVFVVKPLPHVHYLLFVYDVGADALTRRLGRQLREAERPDVVSMLEVRGVDVP